MLSGAEVEEIPVFTAVVGGGANPKETNALVGLAGGDFGEDRGGFVIGGDSHGGETKAIAFFDDGLGNGATKSSGTEVGQVLFEEENQLFFAVAIAEYGVEVCDGAQ